MKRLVRMAISVGLGTAAVLGFGAPGANAAAPDDAGWWTSLNPGSTLGSPTPPPPPDVPDHGLLVEGGPDSPTALAAVVYQLPKGATAGELTLTIAPNSATTPASQVEICPLSDAAVIAEYGGPMADAPTYKCDKKLTASPSDDGKTDQFNVASLAADGALAVAILPATETDRVVLAAPDKNSLTIIPALPSGEPTATTSSSGTGAAATPAPDNTDSSASGSAAPPPSTANVPSLPEATQPAQTGNDPAPQVATPQPSAPTSGFQPSAFAPSTSRTRPVAVILVIATVLLGAALWEAAGRSATRVALGRHRAT
jgi:hypothetical protein